MQASLMGSFLVFLATGAYSITFHNLNSTDVPWINATVYAVIILVGCYYFYIEAFTEIDDETRDKLTAAPRTEWIIRALNQILLLSLWFILEKNIVIFCFSFVALFITFIVWDFITYKYLNNSKIVGIDILGLIASIIFLIADLPLDKNQKSIQDLRDTMQVRNFLVAISVCTLIVMMYNGLKMTKLKPFKKEYWRRPSIH